MTTFIRILIFVVMMAFTSNNLLAQVPPIPCPPPCTENNQNWGTPVFHSFEPDPIGCPDCWIGYWVVSKIFICDDEDIRAFQIIDITCSQECRSCYTTREIFLKAFENAFLHLSFGYPDPPTLDPPNPPIIHCWDNVRFLSASCWSEHFVPGGVLPAHYEFFPCSSYVCCSMTYEICNTGTGLTITATSTPEVGYVCSSSPEFCFTICEWFNYDGYVPTPFPRISINGESDKIFDINNTKNIVLVSPNPADRQVTFNINSFYKGLISITIYDLHGMVISKTAQSKTIFNQEIKINTGNLIPGIYYYSIDRDVNNLARGYFSIIR